MKQALLAAMALTTFSLCSCTSNQETPSSETLTAGSIPPGLSSQFIPVDSANKMIQSYLLSTKDSTNPNKHLQSLILDANALRAYLRDTTITQVKVMFAHTLSYINSGQAGQMAGYTPNALTIVLAGYNASGNYIFAPGNLVPDNARPCPANCPVTGTAVSSLLQ